jgi:hypothetical protein
LATRRRACLATVLTLMLGGSQGLIAQARPASTFARLQTDSVAWQRVLTYVVSELSSELVRAAADTSAQPWHLRIPVNEPQRNLLEAQLRAILRARPVASDDSVFRTLEVGALVIRGDTARVRVQVDETRRCPGTTRTTGWGWATTVLVPRISQGRFWGAARSRSKAVGDKASC